MHRSSLVLLLLVYSCSAVSAKNTWWSNVMDGGETRTTPTWTKSNPVVQLSLGTSVNKRKVKAAINAAAQTPKKFWESKSFESLLRENQKDGLDNVQPVRQVFKSWEYTKEGNKPAKLVEKTWEKNGEFIIPPTVTVIEHNNKNSFKLNEWTTQTPKQTPPVRWDDKPEFLSLPKNKKNYQKSEFEKQREKQKVKIVAKKLVTLKKSLETEDIPIDGIINSNHHESTRLIKKEGLIEEPKKPEKPASAKIWFKMPSTTTERFTTPQVEYAIEDVTPANRRTARKQQLNINVNHRSANSQNQNGNRDQNRPQKQLGTPKLSYRFQWGKRSDENESPKSDNIKVEEPVTDAVVRVNDDDDDEEEEEVTSIKELEEFQAKWEGLARRTFKENDEITTQLPARFQKTPKTEKIEKPNRQPVKLRDNSEDFDKNHSAKEKAKQIYSFSTTIDHGSYKEEKPQKLKSDVKVNARIQKKSGVTEAPAKPQTTPSRLQKRIDTREREREILEDITQRKHNYEIEDEPEERKADQRGPKNDDQGDDGREWRLEDSIPGVPDQDYATHTTVPQTNFKCSDHKLPGYYGDTETKCQAFHVCHSDGRQDSFICPVGTVFNQQLFVCDWWNNFKCDQTSNFYDLNANLYDYSKGGGASGGNKPRGTRGVDTEIESVDADDDEDDGPDINAPLKSGSIYGEEETKGGGSHRSSQVYFPENIGNRRVWKRKLQTEPVTARLSDSRSASSSQLDEDEYWAASDEMPAASFATRLSSLLKVKSSEKLSEQKAKQ